MERSGAQSLAAAQARRTLRTVVGGTTGRQIAWVVVGIVAVSWIADAGWGLLTGVLGAAGAAGWAAQSLALLVVGVALLAALRALAVRAGGDEPIDVQVEPQKARKPGLIVSLSSPARRNEEGEDPLEAFASAETAEDLIRRFEQAGHNWVVPLFAIAHHAPALERVVVVPTEKSARHASRFVEVATRLLEFFREGNGERAVVEVLGAANSSPGGDEGEGAACARPEDMKQSIQAYEAAYKLLRRPEGGAPALRDRCVVMDITSGTKTMTTAAVLVALKEGRTIQYVRKEGDRGDGRLVLDVYDVSYE